MTIKPVIFAKLYDWLVVKSLSKIIFSAAVFFTNSTNSFVLPLPIW